MIPVCVCLPCKCVILCQTARLAIIGGTTLEVRVRRMMANLLTNELASGLNWAGKKQGKEQAKQKRPFKDLALCRSMLGKSCYIFNHHKNILCHEIVDTFLPRACQCDAASKHATAERLLRFQTNYFFKLSMHGYNTLGMFPSI